MTVLDEITGLELIIKRAGESYPPNFVYPNLLDGEVITSINSVSQVNRGDVVGSTDLTIGSMSHDGVNTAQVWLSGGTNGERYCLTVSVTTSTGAMRFCSGVVFVKDAC